MRHVLHCIRANDFVQANRLQSHMQLHLFQPKFSFIHNQLLHLFAKCGKLSYARDLFDNMTHIDIYSWNSLLSSYAKLGLVEDLRTVFDQMPFHDSVSYNTLIAYFATNWHSDKIHERVVIVGCADNTFVWNAITGVYAKYGDIHRARWFFDRTTYKNVVSWNLMISGYVKLGNHDKHVDDARRMFSEIPRKDEICWTKMIVGYAQNRREDDALMLFGDMLHGDVRPDIYTISSVVSSCAKLASLCHGQVVDGKVIVMSVDHSMLVSSALVDLYCKCAVTLDAWRNFGTMPIRNMIT
ncbi:pentatricopeptide repeat-containing protein At2g21090-like [Arachis ipaensis]|uniref:pentatricopeptide repeat-containing protein At2g21090-like n=1 Tax=Arachis ipaensis TaxID=130454 RepID=UPI000A2B8F8B|nr:pentatricopeptide repeat-containing protein At2g21090-like [Arachis ipaensis]XP_025669968.1 pentatricopeptide repeat-containing protein At2g21090-like [Arachis hypogaea]